MKLKTRIVIYFLYSIALLKVVKSTNQLFEKLNKPSLKEESSISKDNSIMNDLNVMGFFQKDLLSLNQNLNTNIKKRAKAKLNSQANTSSNKHFNNKNHMFNEGDSLLKETSILGLNKQINNNPNLNQQLDDVENLSNNINLNNSNDIQSKNSNLQGDLATIEKEGLVNPEKLSNSNEVNPQSIPGGEKFSGMVSTDNTNIVNNETNQTNQDNQLQNNNQGLLSNQNQANKLNGNNLNLINQNSQNINFNNQNNLHNNFNSNINHKLSKQKKHKSIKKELLENHSFGNSLGNGKGALNQEINTMNALSDNLNDDFIPPNSLNPIKVKKPIANRLSKRVHVKKHHIRQINHKPNFQINKHKTFPSQNNLKKFHVNKHNTYHSQNNLKKFQVNKHKTFPSHNKLKKFQVNKHKTFPSHNKLMKNNNKFPHSQHKTVSFTRKSKIAKKTRIQPHHNQASLPPQFKKQLKVSQKTKLPFNKKVNNHQVRNRNNFKSYKNNNHNNKILLNRYKANKKEILALRKRIDTLIKMNDKLLVQIRSSPVLGHQKKKLSHQILSFIQKVNRIKKTNLHNAEIIVEKNFPSLKRKFENLENQINEEEDNMEDDYDDYDN